MDTSHVALSSIDLRLAGSPLMPCPVPGQSIHRCGLHDSADRGRLLGHCWTLEYAFVCRYHSAASYPPLSQLLHASDSKITSREASISGQCLQINNNKSNNTYTPRVRPRDANYLACLPHSPYSVPCCVLYNSIFCDTPY